MCWPTEGAQPWRVCGDCGFPLDRTKAAPDRGFSVRRQDSLLPAACGGTRVRLRRSSHRSTSAADPVFRPGARRGCTIGRPRPWLLYQCQPSLALSARLVRMRRGAGNALDSAPNANCVGESCSAGLSLVAPHLQHETIDYRGFRRINDNG